MSSLLISVRPTLLSVWTLTETNPVTGKAWDRRLSPTCEELIPQSLESRWQLKRKLVPADESTSIDCFFTRQGRDLRVSYKCGGRNLTSPDHHGNWTVDKQSIAKWLAEEARESSDEKLGRLYIDAHDDDTPCEVALSWPKEDGPENARRFMKDILAAATPAAVGKPKLEAIYLDPKSPAGRAFFTSPEAWKKESAGLDGYIALPAGFPKVIDGKDFPGLPQGKLGLVGLCLIGDNAISPKELPGLQQAVIDAPGVEPACPDFTEPLHDARISWWLDWWQRNEDTGIKLGERTLTFDFFYDPSVSIDSNGRWHRSTRARAYLREADGSLVSMSTDEIPLETESDSRTCKATLKKGTARVTLKVFCPLGTPDQCKKNPWWRFTQTVRVVGNKVTITHADERNSGEGCETTYE
jgi:hypothetical protein